LIMGIIKSSLKFVIVAALGVYVAQNYNVPDIKALASTAFSEANQAEHRFRKNSNEEDDN